MNAKLTDDMNEETLKDMLVGEEAWTVPWAMYADRNGDLWLNGNYSLNYSPGGTVEMAVKRVENGYEVNIYMCKNRGWTKGDPSFVGEFVPLPVVKVIKTKSWSGKLF